MPASSSMCWSKSMSAPTAAASSRQAGARPGEAHRGRKEPALRRPARLPGRRAACAHPGRSARRRSPRLCSRCARPSKSLHEARTTSQKSLPAPAPALILLEAGSGIYNEIQPGSYIFMDADYNRNLDEDGKPLTVLRAKPVRLGDGHEPRRTRARGRRCGIEGIVRGFRHAPGRGPARRGIPQGFGRARRAAPAGAGRNWKSATRSA